MRDPLIRSVTVIAEAELFECRDKGRGDVAEMVKVLGVPLKALKDRLARLSQGPRL